MVLNDAEFYLSFNNEDLSGTNPQDLSGNARHGTNSGATIDQTGKLLNCFSFDGVNDYVSTSWSGVTGTTARSISVWVTNTETSGSEDIVNYGTNSTGANWVWRYDTTNKKIGLYVANGYREWALDLSDGNFHHLVITFPSGQSTNDLILYHNNSVISASSTSDRAINTGTTYNFRIGQEESTDLAEWTGKIDELGVWNRVLSASEVSDLYNNGNGYNPYDTFSFQDLYDDQVYYWKFDGNAVETITSSTATITGASGTTGLIGSAYEYDGTGTTYIQDTSLSSDIFTGDFSANFWVYRTSTDTYRRMVTYYISGTKYFQFVQDSSDDITFLTRANESTERGMQGQNDFVLNEWEMITATYNNSTNTITLYRNGFDVSDSSTSGYGIGTNTGATFGIRNDNSSSKYTGKIDEVGIWNRVLTQQEIFRLQNADVGKQYPYDISPVSGWTGKINSITDPAKVNGIAVANISKINGVE